MTDFVFSRLTGPLALACSLVCGGAHAGPLQCQNGLNGGLSEVPPARFPSAKNFRTADAELLNLNLRKGKSEPAPALDNQGLIDGVYACDVTVNGATERALLSFNGKANGQTVYVVAGLKTHYQTDVAKTPINQPFRGWGIGTITATEFAGKTWDNQAFSFKLLGLEEHQSQGVYNVLRISGKVGVAGGRTALLVCKTDRALFF